jgi:hypothetical protein
MASPFRRFVLEFRRTGPGGTRTRSMKKLPLALLLASLASQSGLANDSTAELATGGLVFVRNDDIEMRAEDLYISAAEIRVRYRFFNKAAKDVTVHVAFPLPEVRVEHPDQNISIPIDDPVNFVGFTTSVNGRRVATQYEQKATAAGVDRTAYLRGLGIPLALHLAATSQALDRLPRDKRDELIKLGLAEIEEYDAGQGMERHLSARWALSTTFYWQQTFPAQQETVIEHRYKPSVGGTVQTVLGSALVPDAQDEIRRKYCVEDDIIRALQRAARKSGDDGLAPYAEARIEYILKTGANWSGPIRDFRLVVDKGDPKALVSFCGERVKKIGPTRFEMRRADYTPDGNFSVLILTPIRGQ